MTLQVAMRLQNLRKQKGYSQEELADKIGVSRQAVSKWERAESSPDTDNLITLARLYGVSLDELVGEDAAADEPRAAEEAESASQETGEGENSEPQEAESDKEEDEAHVGFDGIHIDSEDGDHVHIDRNGIHVDSADGDHVHIDASGVHVIDSATVQVHSHRAGNRVTGIVGAVAVFGSVIAYILLGALLDLWHPGWIVFFAIPVLPSLSDAIVKRNPSHFAYPVFVVAVYLLLGCLYGWWHPGWVIFLTIPVYYVIADACKKKY